jgi:tetratricopeptide (TPR) repeat protein
MLTRDLPTTQTALVVEPQPLEAILAEEGDHPLAFVLPPSDDAKAIEELQNKSTSLEERAAEIARNRAPMYAAVLEDSLRKFEQFSRSPTYLNRLANLAAVSLDDERERSFLAMARSASDDPFFTHRYADSLLARGQADEAERLFRCLDLDQDLSGNLKLAVFHVRRGDLEAAHARVHRALSIDPLDFGALLFDGGLKLLSGSYEQAIRSLRLALEERPASASVHINMGVAYAKLAHREAALSALKKAVAVSPLNTTAVFVLSDLAFDYGRNEEAIPALRYLLQFEQKLTDGWSRLARASLQLKDTDTAIAALRRQASLAESSRVWNNLGVAYAIRRDLERALPAFKQALAMAESSDRDYFLAARNIAQLLAELDRGDELLRFTSVVLKSDGKQLVRQDSVLSDLYGLHLHALRRTGQRDRMREIAGQILTSRDFPDRLVAWTLASVIAYDTLYATDTRLVLSLYDEWRSWIEHTSLPDDRKLVLYNNLAFALAESGRLDEAESFLRRIGSRLHKDAYPTATLGLVSLKRGHVERGIRRYREAISLAKTRLDKSRIRQKLNIELARIFAHENPTRARRLLASVIKAGDGEPALVEQARSVLAGLASE